MSGGRGSLRSAAQALEVTIVGATSLHDDGFDDAQVIGSYCVCEIPGRPSSRFETGVVDDIRNPTWEFECSIPDYTIGDPLTVTVFHQDRGAGAADVLNEALMVGVVSLPSTHFYPGGFHGALPLFEGVGSASAGANLQLSIRLPEALGSEQQNTSETVDVTVQVDTFTGLPRRPDQPPGRPHTYLLRAVWLGQEGGLRTSERTGRPSVDGRPHQEDCVFKQQVKLRGAPGADQLVVGLFRLLDDTGQDELIGACKLEACNPAHHQVQTHAVTDRDGNPIGAYAKMKLKVDASSDCDARGGGRRRAPFQLQQVADDTDEEWPASSPSQGSVKGAAQKFSPPQRGRATSPRGRHIDPFDGAPDRVHELYALHEQRQAKLEQKMRDKEEEEILWLEEQREALKKTRAQMRGWTLSPSDASARLYEDANRRRVRMEEEKSRQDDVMVRGLAKPQNVDAHAVSNRLYKEHSRRLQVQEAKRAEKEAREADEIQRNMLGVGRVGEGRHEQMYMEAEAKRERLEKMRKEQEERERQKFHNGARKAAVNPKRWEEMYEEHARKRERMAKLKQDHQLSQQATLAKAAARARPSSPPRRACCTVSAAIHGVDTRAFLHAESTALVEACKDAVHAAITAEVEMPAVATGMNTDFTEGPSGELQLEATLQLPLGERSEAAWEALDGCYSLCEVLAAALESVEGIAEVLAESITVDGVNVSGLTKVASPARCRPAAAPSARLLSNTQSGISRTQSHPSTKPPAPELKTPVDYALAAAISAVQLRCGTSFQLGATELKSLAAPLSVALAAYSAAQAACEKSEGYSALVQRCSQRLCQGVLLPDQQAWSQGREVDHIHQVQEDLEELLRTAEGAQAILEDMIAPPGSSGAGSWAPGDTIARPGAVPWALFAYSAGPKSREAALTKALVRYGPAEGELRFRHILDFARVTLVFPSCDTLMSGLDALLGKLDVAAVRNNFGSAGRLGRRHVDLIVVVSVPTGDDPDEGTPHVCEVRLEEEFSYNAHEQAFAALDQFALQLRKAFKRRGVDVEGLAYLAKCALGDPPEKQAIRIFRRRFTQHFGSVVSCWRTLLGNSHLVSFERFKKACQVMKFGDHAVEYWSELDVNLGGCISLFEMDPEAASLLAKLYTRVVALLDGQSPEDVEAEVLFHRLTIMSKLRQPDRLDSKEFRALARSLGFTDEEAGRAVNYLDCQGGRNPPVYVTVKDIAWLKNLPSLIDIEATLLPPAQYSTEGAEGNDEHAQVEASRPFELEADSLDHQADASSELQVASADEPVEAEEELQAEEELLEVAPEEAEDELDVGDAF